MNYAIIDNGVVVNVALSDEPLDENWIESSDACIGDLYSNGAFSKPAYETPLADLKANAKRQVDADVDAVIAAVVGNRAQEYLEAERQARAYISAGYTGTVPDYVAADASAYGKTAKWSADRIVATADAWLAAQLAMRAQRLGAKAQLDGATTHADVRAALSTWVQALAPIKTGLGI